MQYAELRSELFRNEESRPGSFWYFIDFFLFWKYNTVTPLIWVPCVIIIHLLFWSHNTVVSFAAVVWARHATRSSSRDRVAWQALSTAATGHSQLNSLLPSACAEGKSVVWKTCTPLDILGLSDNSTLDVTLDQFSDLCNKKSFTRNKSNKVEHRDEVDYFLLHQQFVFARGILAKKFAQSSPSPPPSRQSQKTPLKVLCNNPL